MTLADLLSALLSRNALSTKQAKRTKDYQTSLRYLAAALGHDSPATCALDVATRDIDAWLAALETHFQALTAQGRSISAATRRNTRNNIRVLFRLAETQGLLQAPLPVRLLAKPKREAYQRQHRETALYQSTYHPTIGPRDYGLPQAQWPPDVQAGWQAYQTRCGLRVRETTLQVRAWRLASYVGYLVHVAGTPLTWDACFDPEQLMAFVRWHGTRLGRRISVFARQVAITLAHVAKELEHPNAQALAKLRNALPRPEPMHVKRDHWVTLAQLEEVANACLSEGRLPFNVCRGTRNPGAYRASQFQKGLILKLLVRIPLRQRNVREIQLGKHLYQDQGTKHWHLHLQGDDLKIGTRKEQVNTYHVNLSTYCPDWPPLLEEFLETYRPRLRGAETPYLFLTTRGRPYNTRGLHEEIAAVVGMRTGKRFYPHLIRTIWATECLERTKDFQLAASMLGDTLKVVMDTYYDVVHTDQHAKAAAFLASALRAG
jgi:site-specific recombinase XerD